MPSPARFAFVLMLVFIARPALGQDEERRGFIGLGIGPSLPFGSFADASPDNARAGRATSGYSDTFLNIGYRFGRRIGVAAAFTYSEYPMRGDGDDDWYQVAGLTVGPMYTYRLGAKGGLDLKALIGRLALTPVVDSYTTSDGVGNGVAVEMRAAVRYDLLRRWAVFAEGGVQTSAVSFDTGTRKDVRALISGFGIAFRPMW